MLFKEIMNQQWEAGHQEGLLEGRIDILQEIIFVFLEQYGKLPDALASKIKDEKNETVLKSWRRAASKATSLEDFTQNM